jgi:putative ABC transport system permease protein
VIGAFLLQHVSLATVGVLAGAAITQWVGPLLPGVLGDGVSLWRTLPEHAWSLPVVSLGTVLVIACGTVLAGWRAARLPAVPLTRTPVTGRSHMSSAARVALRLHTPPALVLGWRGVLHRPVRSAGTALRLALSVLMITVTLGTWATLNCFEHEPARVGLAGTLTARPASLAPAAAEELLSGAPGVADVYPQTELAALAPGQNGTVTLRGLGTTAHLYPFAVMAGRAPTGPNEAVAGQGLLDTLHLSVGQWVRLTVGGTPHILHIVGRNIEIRHQGVVISTSFDTLHDQDATVPPDAYTLRLRPGAHLDAIRAALAAASHGRLEVREVTNPAVALAPARGVIVGLVLVLALIGLAELLTAIAAELRDHTRDLSAYRAVGLTPQQTAATMAAGVALIVAVAAVAGTVAGRFASDWLIDFQARSSGIGAGIARPPTPSVTLAVILTAVTGAAGVALPLAARLVRARDWRETLHAE